MKNKVKAFLITILIIFILIGLYMYAEKYLNFSINLKTLLICMLAMGLYHSIKEDLYESEQEKRKNEVFNYEKEIEINKIGIVCSRCTGFKNVELYAVDFILYNDDIKISGVREMFMDESEMQSSLMERNIDIPNYDEVKMIDEKEISYTFNIHAELIQICDSSDSQTYYELNLYDKTRNYLLLRLNIVNMEIATKIMKQLSNE